MMNCGLDSAGALLTRHCAYCLTEITGEAIKKCGKCHKRAYCSRKCQAKDWAPNKIGQGHKNWCGIEYGEEDVDWMVTSIPGKGLGIVALRDIPAAYKIIVEPVVDETHPGVADLMPLNGSLEKKYAFNMFGPMKNENGVEIAVVSLRLSRVNHSCVPNADHFYDKYAKLNILFALEDIKKGEEICILYMGFVDINATMSPKTARRIMRAKWGITCDQNCLCFDKAFYQKVKQGRKLDKALHALGLAQTRHEELAALRRCRCPEVEKDLNMLAINVKRTLEGGLQIKISEMNVLELILYFLNEASAKRGSSTCRTLPEDSAGGGGGTSGSDTKKESQTFSVYRIRVIPKRLS